METDTDPADTDMLTNHHMAELHKTKGTEFYKEGNWQSACQEYG